MIPEETMSEQSTTINYRDPQALVQTGWLQDHLHDNDLRIFDCTTYLLPADEKTKAPYIVASGRADYEKSHIPGAGFLDLQGELSDNTTELRFMLPPAEQFAEVIGRHGVGDGSRVVLYSAGHMMWATRLWWMLRAFGFDNAAVLDGGWDKWLAEQRPVSDEACHYPPATFTARPRPDLVVDKQAVLAALGDTDYKIVNALGASFHQGLEASRYGRPGRIPGSLNVPAASLLNHETRALVPLEQAQARFDEVGIAQGDRVIAYCGGGISATIDLLLLYQLGYDKLALYDGSMGEWATDTSLPIATG
jgi:thiosulfate/3-mercaptopyruvate sulfurtransferase